MKKTMFITSVIMVVVMAIALTTSSLAWFSAGGTDHVTTNALRLTAAAESATGIAISHDRSEWSTESIALTSDGTATLLPVVPFTKDTAKDADEAAYAALLAALVGGREAPYVTEEDFQADLEKYNDDDSTTVATYASVYDAYIADTENVTSISSGDYATLVSAGYLSSSNYYTTTGIIDYGAYMIGARIDGNANFKNSAYRNGFYTDTLYLRNMAQGSTNADIKVSVDCAFTFQTYVNNGTPESPVWVYGDDTAQEYTSATRGASKYNLDPILCVAVLAQTNYKVTDANYAEWMGDLATLQAAAANMTGSELAAQQALIDAKIAQIAGLDVTPTWEIIGYFQSKGTGVNTTTYETETLKIGKNTAAFGAGAASGSSYYQYAFGTTINLNKTNTVALRGAHSVDEYDMPADILPIKVVAWYDGATLNNNNSSSQYKANDPNGSADLRFDLKFNKESAN